MESAPQPTKQRFQFSLSRDIGLYDVTMFGVVAMMFRAKVQRNNKIPYLEVTK